MRLAGLRSLLFLVVAIAVAGAIAGCDNPFDPLKSSDKIQGLSYFDFSATQEHWDSDPEWDGLQITLNYYNEFGDTLSFHDKSHKITDRFLLGGGRRDRRQSVTRTFLTSKTVDILQLGRFYPYPDRVLQRLARDRRSPCRHQGLPAGTRFPAAGIPAEGTCCPLPVRGDFYKQRRRFCPVVLRTGRAPRRPFAGLSRFSPRPRTRHSPPRETNRSRAGPRPDPRAAPPAGGIRARRRARGRTR